MRGNDPLEEWLLLRAYRSEAELADQQQRELGNEFEVETIDIRPGIELGTYPRIVERKGEAPPQYDWLTEDEDT